MGTFSNNTRQMLLKTTLPSTHDSVRPWRRKGARRRTTGSGIFSYHSDPLLPSHLSSQMFPGSAAPLATCQPICLSIAPSFHLALPPSNQPLILLQSLSQHQELFACARSEAIKMTGYWHLPSSHIAEICPAVRLRCIGTTGRVVNTELREERESLGKPLNSACSSSVKWYPLYWSQNVAGLLTSGSVSKHCSHFIASHDFTSQLFSWCLADQFFCPVWCQLELVGNVWLTQRAPRGLHSQRA